MKPATFHAIARLVREHSGLRLTAEQDYMLESRLAPLLPEFGVQTLDQLAERLERSGYLVILDKVADALTTNETHFFRDIRPFDHFRQTLPQLLALPSPSIRLWSAACSTGQEAYSLAMTIMEECPGEARRFEIVATDFSSRVVRRAQEGMFTPFEVQRGLPEELRRSYFEEKGGAWQIAPQLRNMVQFGTRNLLGDLGSLGYFDIVFCRNVLIYFDAPTKARVLSALANCMRPHALLYLGAAETARDLCPLLAPLPSMRGVYARAGMPQMAC